jgi:RNA polymerase sigma-70 factor (ECF subfamily)
MGTVQGTRHIEGAAVLEAARDDDRWAFGALAERHRPELLLHCYRMLGSLEDAEDVVQETFLRAWDKRASFQGRAPFRAWLYGIATHASLDAIARLRRRPPASPAGAPGPAEVAWLQPYPDRLLERVAPDDEPEDALVAKETVELAFLVAIQHLPPAQRAVLVVRDVLGWSARETAALLESSVASVNSSLQRARATLKRNLPEPRLESAPLADPSDAERVLLTRYMDACERDDVDGLARLMSEDVRFSMPPGAGRYVGREAVVARWIAGGFGSGAYGRIRCLPTRANMQPAVADYVRRPGDSRHRPRALDVIRIEDGLLAEIVAFPPGVFPAFGLPSALPGD